MKKIVSVILVFTMILTLTACNSKGSTTQTSGTGDANSAQESNTATTSEVTATEPITIQFWNSFTGSDGDILREIVDEFNKENTDGITIEMDIMSGENLSQKLPAAIATETAPALVLMSPADMVSYTESESLVDLSDFFDSTDCDKTDFNETALELFQYEGKQMLIPMQIQSTYFYWNKDLFEAAGLDPEVPPKTWDEVADYAVKLTDSSKNQYGFGMPVSGAPTWFNAMFLAKGGSAVDLETKKSTLNSEENLEVLQYIQDLANKGVTPQGATGTDTDNLLYAGKLAMYVNGPWVISGLKEAGINFGISLMPEDVCILDGMGFAVTKGTSTEAISAAYKFIAYWNTSEICKKWSLENGFPPYLKSLAEDPDILADATLSVTANMVNIGKTWLSGLNVASKIDSEILFPMIEAVESGADPADTLKKSSDYIDELLSKY